jgi:hypothetical protein
MKSPKRISFHQPHAHDDAWWRLKCIYYSFMIVYSIFAVAFAIWVVVRWYNDKSTTNTIIDNTDTIIALSNQILNLTSTNVALTQQLQQAMATILNCTCGA